jgi:thiamine transport system substrate-binding protein
MADIAALEVKMRTLLKSVMAMLAVTIPAVAVQAADTPVLTIYTYDSFASEWGPGPAIEKAFESECACDVNFVALDSSIGILGRVQLEGPTSKADIVLGLDTNLMETARNTGLFKPHDVDVAGRAALPVAFADDYFVPFDWGYFAFVYNSETMATPPASLQALVDAPDDVRIVIQDPRTSTPGLGLLLWVRSVYGEDAAKAWAGLAPKIVTVTKGWWDAYSMFLDGEADMVLSYSTSPAYHIVAESTDKYRAAAFDEGHYLQVEVAAMLKNAPQPTLARQFMNFILEPEFQSVIPTTNWMYPAAKADLPASFDGLIQPAEARLYSPKEVAQNKSAWVSEWQRALRQ